MHYIVSIFKSDHTSNRVDGEEARYNLEANNVNEAISILERLGYLENAAEVEVCEVQGKAHDNNGYLFEAADALLVDVVAL